MKKLSIFACLITLTSFLTVLGQSTTILPGIILPQMTTAQRTAIASLQNGMLVFDTNTQSYWFRQSSTWVNLSAGGSSYWQLAGAGGNEIQNTNTGGFWSANPTGLTENSNNTTNPPTAPVSGAGTRLMWIPSRSAFRVGTVEGPSSSYWDASNIGLFSFASGFNTRASEEVSTAMGAGTTASGSVSTAMGIGTTASGGTSTAMGQFTTASGGASTAMGYRTTASGYFSTAMGEETTASRQASTAMGRYNVNNPNALFMVGNGSSNNSRVNIFTIRGDNSRVGIGTDDPIAPLHVGPLGLINTGALRYFETTAPGFINQNPSAANTSIYANFAIISGTLVGAAQNVTASDVRIKNIMGRSDNVADLDLLKKIQITNYRMKDEGTWGKQIFRKVIAQEVEKIYPEAVRQQTSIIPDIYALAEKVNYDANKKELTVFLSKNYDLKIDDKIELVHPEKGKIRTTISAVLGNAFTVKDWLYETDKIFVFGREVNDFRVIDYEALSMLGISAIQQLAKENSELRAKSENTEARLEKLESLVNQLLSVEVNNKTSNK